MQDATSRILGRAILGRAALGAMLAAAPVAIAGAVAAQDPATAPATPAAGTQATGTPAATPATATPATPAPVAPATAGAADQRIETRIRQLHEQLSITPAQEALWGDFTAVMRRNAAETRSALQARSEAFGRMDAVSDLKSYAELTAQRSRSIEALIAPFGALYAALSPEQKKAADRTFRNYTDRAVAHPK